ncbi:MAG: cytochrome c [Acidobacteriota bacterium]
MKPAATALLLLSAGSFLALACGPEDRSPPALYGYYCAQCHGDQGQGNPRLDRPNLDLRESTLLSGDRQDAHRRIAEGYKTMPSFRNRLSPAEIEALIDFTRRFRQDEPAIGDAPTEPNL